MNEHSRKQAPDAGGLSLHSTLIDHAAIQAAVQPWIEMECFQLSRGKRLGQLDCLDLGNTRIVREYQHATVQKIGATPGNLCTLSFCTLDRDLRFSEHDAGDVDTVFFLSENSEFDIHVPAGVQTTYISLDQDEFLSAARVLNPAQWETAPQGVQPLRSNHKALFSDAVEIWFKTASVAARQGGAMDADVMRRLLLQTMLQVATTTIPDDAGTVPAAARVRALRICRQACAFAEDRLEADDLPTIVDLCTAVGVSERTLQYAFRSYVGMSPLVYLRLLRLNRVRTTLIEASPGEMTVTEAAMRYGFLHLSRFARDYRHAFDESPSETLAA